MRPHYAGLVTEEQRSFAERVAAGQGLEIDEYIRRILDESFERAAHLERCRPKVAGEGGGAGRRAVPGRPINAVSSERVLTLAKSLRVTYAKLREHHGEGFDKLFGSQVAELESAIQNKDASCLEKIEREKKWILRKW
jgi:hypothetical protein